MHFFEIIPEDSTVKYFYAKHIGMLDNMALLRLQCIINNTIFNIVGICIPTCCYFRIIVDVYIKTIP